MRPYTPYTIEGTPMPKSLMRWFLLPVLFGLLSVTGIQAQETPDDETVPRFEQSRCRYPQPRSVEITCGFLVVPADRNDPTNDATLQVAVAILHSNAETPEPDPVVSLTGGPGAITLPILNFQMRRNYYAFLENRDFIMFDQRGVGASRPVLDCPDIIEDTYAIVGMDAPLEERLALENALLLDCLDAILEAGIQPETYTTAQNAADLADLRIALGYDEWNLFGVSYGTKLALTTMRDHPEGLRSVILDSTYPLQVDLFTTLGVNRQRAFELLFNACQTDAACYERTPYTQDTFYRLVNQLNEDPIIIESRNLRYGFEYTVRFTGDMLIRQVFSMLYVKDLIPTIPRFISDIALGNTGNLAPIVETLLNNSDFLSEGMYYSVQCAEELRYSNIDDVFAQIETLHPAIQEFHRAEAQAFFDLCAEWQAFPAEPRENEPVISDIPTLVLAGEFDPITPPAWGELAADDLENSFFYELPAVGHGVVRSDACGLSLAVQFLAEPTAAPDASCIDDLPPPNFNRNFGG